MRLSPRSVKKEFWYESNVKPKIFTTIYLEQYQAQCSYHSKRFSTVPESNTYLNRADQHVGLLFDVSQNNIKTATPLITVPLTF